MRYRVKSHKLTSNEVQKSRNLANQMGERLEVVEELKKITARWFRWALQETTGPCWRRWTWAPAADWSTPPATGWSTRRDTTAT